jgi:hypothetical protein
MIFGRENGRFKTNSLVLAWLLKMMLEAVDPDTL